MKRRQVLFAAPALLLGASVSGDVTVATLIRGLDHPWGLTVLPDGRVLVTERAGRLRLLTPRRGNLRAPVAGTPEVAATGQGGLLDVTLDPQYTDNQLIYLSFAEPRPNGNCTSVFRARLNTSENRLEEGRIIFRQDVAYAGSHHFGSRLVFDNEGHLFVTTGDRYDLRDEAQNPGNHIGKVLRITRDGEPAPGNPGLPGWAPEVWSIGHRNLQGAALHPDTGALWTVEHGPKGGDELNHPEAGKNYGWPVITHGKDYSGAPIGVGKELAGMEQPVHHWTPSIAPSGLMFYSGKQFPNWKGNAFVGALAGQHIARLVLDQAKVVEEERLFTEVARFRAVKEGLAGEIYLLTDEPAPHGALMQIVNASTLTQPGP